MTTPIKVRMRVQIDAKKLSLQNNSVYNAEIDDQNDSIVVILPTNSSMRIITNVENVKIIKII